MGSVVQDLTQGCNQGVVWGCSHLKGGIWTDLLLSLLSGFGQDSVPGGLLAQGPSFFTVD